jgi:hypothetical protein
MIGAFNFEDALKKLNQPRHRSGTNCFQLRRNAGRSQGGKIRLVAMIVSKIGTIQPDLQPRG